MLTLIAFAARRTRPQADPIDRDPGLISLSAALLKTARGTIRSAIAQVRSTPRGTRETERFDASRA